MFKKSYKYSSSRAIFSSSMATSIKGSLPQIEKTSKAIYHKNISYFFDYFSPWIVVLINPVPKTKKGFLFLLHFHDKLGNILLTPDILQHPNHSFVCPSMLRTIQCPSSHRYSSIDINSRTGNMPDKRSRTVHFVLSMKDK